MNVLIAVSPDDILNVSKTDLEKALKLFRDYVKVHPKASKTIESLGSVLYAKKALEDWELGEYVIEEDLEGLLKALGSSDVVIDHKKLKLLKSVFGNLDDRFEEGIEKLDPLFLNACKKFPPFLNVNAESFAKNLVEAYMTGTVPSSFDSLSSLDCVSNKREIRNTLKDVLKNFIEEGEGYYMKVYNIARILGLNSEEFSQIKEYADLYLKLNSIDPNSLDLEDYQKFLKEFLNIKLEKSVLRGKLASLASGLLKRGHDLSRLCNDPQICPRLTGSAERDVGRSSNEKISLLVISSIAVIVLVVFLARSSNPRVRLKRLKRKLSKDPLNANLHLKMARVYEKLGMVEEAMNEYRIASDLIDSGTDQS